MDEMDTVYPQYAFASHKGYATAQHLRLLAEHGPCRLHRRSFAPVESLLELGDDLDWDSLMELGTL
jgi:ribonuclease HII